MGFGINISFQGVAQTLQDAVFQGAGEMSGRVLGWVERAEEEVGGARNFAWGSVIPNVRWLFDRGVVSPVCGGVRVGKRFLDFCRPHATYIGLMSNGFYAAGCMTRLGTGFMLAQETMLLLDIQKGHSSDLYRYVDFPGSHISLLNFILKVREVVSGLKNNTWGWRMHSSMYLEAQRLVDEGRQNFPLASDDDSRNLLDVSLGVANQQLTEAEESLEELKVWEEFYLRRCNSNIDASGHALNSLQLLSWGVRNIAETTNKWLRAADLPVIPLLARSLLLLGCSVVSIPSSMVSIYRSALASIHDPRFREAVLDAKQNCGEDATLQAIADYLLLEKKQNRYYFFMMVEVLFLIGNIPTLIAFAGNYSEQVSNAIVDMEYGLQLYSLCAGPINWLASSSAVGLLMYQKVSDLRYRNNQYKNELGGILRLAKLEIKAEELSSRKVGSELLLKLVDQLGSEDEGVVGRAKGFLKRLKVFSDEEVSLLASTAESLFFEQMCVNPGMRDECVQVLRKVFGVAE